MRWRIRKGYLIPLLAAVAVIIVVGALRGSAILLSLDGGVRLDGPHGAFPAPLSSQPAAHPDRMITKSGNVMLIDGGLGLQADLAGGLNLGSDTVTAVSLRTGSVYWRYQRPGYAPEDWETDPRTGDLYIVWTNSEDRSLVDAVRPRSGERLWTYSTSTWWPDASIIQPGNSGTLAVVHEGQNAGGVTGIDVRSGHRRWTRPWPGCNSDGTELIIAERQAVAGADVAAISDCPQGYGDVFGVDAATGKLRWNISYPGWSYYDSAGNAIADDIDGVASAGGSLVAVSDNSLNAISFVDAATGRQVERRRLGFPDGAFVKNDIMVGGCGRVKSSGYTAVCADDPVTGREKWRASLPPHTVLGGLDGEIGLGSWPVYISGGVVYALAVKNSMDAPQLMVMSARNGAILDSPGVGSIMWYNNIYNAGDGAVVLNGGAAGSEVWAGP